MHETPSGNLHHFFAGLAEFTFQARLGVADPPLVDYISNLLARFIRQDDIFRVRNLQGQPLTAVIEMFSEAEQRFGAARRKVHQHIGDFTLFWSGMYPEALCDRQVPTAKDVLIDYCQHGKRSYMIASSIEVDEDSEAPSEVLERLSTEFELCAYGLREIRNEWSRRDDPPPTTPFLIN
jgi:hypothetical protein